MAKLDDLISQVADNKLRDRLVEAATELRQTKKFGLVFEEHIPETVVLPSAGLRKGSVVVMRTEPANPQRYIIDALSGSAARISAGSEQREVALQDLLVVKPFGEPVYPVLRCIGSVRRSLSKSYHAIVNGENFHALQLAMFAFEGKVDCIYIDPPYNSGARDWRYNNDYVDSNDRYRHSKWLSFMEKRIKLARRLLKTDSVMVVTIDENEVARLGVLLQQLFKEATITLVTIVNNPKGVTRATLSRVEEYAYFCFFGSAQIYSIADDLLTPGVEDIGEVGDRVPRWKGLLRSGSNALRVQHPTFFYPILIDPERGAIVGTGESPPLGTEPDPDDLVDGRTAVWPVRKDGRWGRWMLKPQTLRAWAEMGYVALGQRDLSRKTWGITYLTTEPQAQIVAGILEVRGRDPRTGVVDVAYASSSAPSRRVKTVWHRTSHDAGVGGTAVLEALLGSRMFDYPKSVYAVRDTLAMLTRTNPRALIVDFFAGSGTTLHATAMLNSEDDGDRRCILITNNEVDENSAKELYRQGAFVGDHLYEAAGICRAVTIPRVVAALSGVRPDGQPVKGTYLDGRSSALGFDDNAAFFDLDYADPDGIDVGNRFDSIIPALWLAAGCKGSPENLIPSKHWLMPIDSPFAVLLDEDHFKSFRAALTKRPDITHLWLVTDSETAYARMREQLGDGLVIGMLYRDYLRNFRVNLDVAALDEGMR